MSGWSDQETRDPLYADDRMFYKVEKWTRDGTAVDCLLYAGNSLAKAGLTPAGSHQLAAGAPIQ